MNCPKCGNELSPGWMAPGKICYLEWAPERWHFPLPPKNRVEAQSYSIPEQLC